MPITRRTLLKQMAVTSAGLLLIPSCMEDRGKSSILLKNFTIDGKQEEMLAELSETIIPKTDSPGAKDIYAHLFALKMIDDCRSKEEQERFKKGMAAFEQFAKEKTGTSFSKATPQQRTELLSALESAGKEKATETDNRNAFSEDLRYFYGSVKGLTLQAYTSSKHYLTDVRVYELIPSRYHGCVPYQKSA